MKRALLALAVVAAAAGVAVVATKGPPQRSERGSGALVFGVLGDAPYYAWEEVQYRLLLRDVAAHDLDFVVHVGDAFWRPCSDERYERAAGWMAALHHPVVYTPGDNEWADCWEPGSGSFRPEERLRHIRQVFFSDPVRSLGEPKLSLASQVGREPFAEYVENAVWTKDGVVFVTVHLIGTDNGRTHDPLGTPADDEVKRRTRAAAEWLREGFRSASEGSAKAVVVAFHANPSFEQPPEAPARMVFEPFLTALEEEVERFSGETLVVHGDGHEYLVDHPLVRRTTGRTLDRCTRMQVPGSPLVGWVRVTLPPGGAPAFEFEARILPRWKYW